MLSKEQQQKIDFTLRDINWDVSTEDIKNSYNELVRDSDTKINTILDIQDKQRTFGNTIVSFENFLSDFSKYGYIQILAQASINPDIRIEANLFNEKLSNFITDILYRVDLYNAIQSYIQGNFKTEKARLTNIENYLVDKIILDFKRLGHGLAINKKERLKEIIKESTKLEIDFEQALNEVKTTLSFSITELEGLPDSALESFSKNGDMYIVTLKNPDFLVVMKYAKNFSTRDKMLQAYMNRAYPENTQRLQTALALRREFVKILNYPNYATYVQEVRMAKNPEKVINFLEDLKNKTKIAAKRELDIYLDLKKQETGKFFDNVLKEADYSYYSRIYEEKESGIEQEKLKEYFPMEHVLQSMLELYQKIFHLVFVKLNSIQTWQEDVTPYAVLNKEMNEFIGIFYLDLYPREGKYSHYAAFTVSPGLKSNKTSIYPVSVMLCNFPRPTNNTPSLLPHEDVETLFHEFGHVIHMQLGSTQFRRFSGTSVAWDFVETPSQILENWVWESDVLKDITSHYKTNEPLPDEMIQALLRSRKINKGSQYIRQIFLAIFDQHIHTMTITDLQDYYNELSKEIRMFQLNPSSNFLSGFGHIMGGYDASYYGYLWAEVIADDIYKTKFSKNPKSEETGLNYRKNILEYGGSIDAEVLITNYLGRDFQNIAFLQKLGLNS